MPTALLPGIGASIRSERAARAIARSSDSASIRLTLTSGAGWTSYWVTTGPAFRPTILAGMPKPASFLTMISSLRRWAAWSPPALIGSAMSSSVVIGGRTYSIRSFVGGESPASVTSSGSRSRRGTTSVAERGGGPRRGERRRDRTGARDGARDRRRLVVAPGAGLARRRPGGHGLRDGSVHVRSTARLGVVRLVGGSRPSGRCPPERLGRGRPDPARGADGRVEQLAKRDPEADHQPQRGQRDQDDQGARSRDQVGQGRVQGAPDAPAGDADDLRGADHAGVRDGQAQHGDAPARSRAAAPDPIPATSRRRAGRAGAASAWSRTRARTRRSTSWSGCPCPVGMSAIRVIAPSTSRTSPRIDRTTSGVRRPASGLVRRVRAALRAAGLRVVVRRRVATARPRRRPGRPSAGASSARTGSARRRP